MNRYIALTGKLNNLQLRAVMLRFSAWMVVLCSILIGLSYGPMAALGAATLMSVPLLPFSQTVVLCANAGLTTLLPIAVQALDVVSREMVGFIPCVNRDPRADRLAKNQTLYSWVAPTISIADIVPGATSPQAADRTLGNKPIALVNFKAAGFYFTGEEENQLNQTGSYGGIIADTVEQAFRTIVNQMESDLALIAQVAGSRAYGTVGTTPFATNVGESAQIKKILDDNGAPTATRSLIIDTTTGASLRTLTNLTKVNEAGTNMTLRDGQLLDLNALSIKESAQIVTPAVGTGASYTTNTAGYAVGATAITLITGTGTILAGDIITFAGDTNKYVVTSALSAGVVTIAAPGLRKAIPTSATAVTVLGSGPRMAAFSRNALLLATRLPARPSGGDLAEDVAVITDARSGISLELARYPQYRQTYYEVSAAWGANAVKNEHIAILLG